MFYYCRADEGAAVEAPPKSPKEQQWKGLEHTSSIGSMTIVSYYETNPRCEDVREGHVLLYWDMHITTDI